MNSRFKKTVSLLASMVLIGTLKMYSQNFTEDFKAINRAYISGNLAFNIRFDYYNDYLQPKPSYFYSGVVKTKGRMMYYKMQDVEFYYDSIYTGLIDHKSKTIMIDTVRRNTDYTQRINFIDSLSKSYKSVTYKTLEGNNAMYTIYSLIPGISHSEVVFNKSTKMIQKMTIFFLENRPDGNTGTIRNKLVITYSSINTSASNTAKTFSMQNFLTSTGRKALARAQYRQYRIINNMQ